MPMAFDASSSVNSGTTSPVTFSHTCTGSNRILFIGVDTNNNSVAGDQVTGVTYNGVAMTLVDKILVDSFGEEYLFVLFNPASGANTISIAFNNSSDTNVSAVATSYTGANQTGPVDASATGSANPASEITTTLTTIADNCWTVKGVRMGATGTAGAGTTKRVENDSFVGMYDSNAAITPAGSTSLIVSRTGNSNLKSVMASFAPVAAASIIVTRRMLRGIGT